MPTYGVDFGSTDNPANILSNDLRRWTNSQSLVSVRRVNRQNQSAGGSARLWVVPSRRVSIFASAQP